MHINPGVRPVSVNVGMFHKPRVETGMKPAGKAGEVYFAIALTDLNKANGLFVLSKTTPNPSTDQAEERLTLKPGDGVIWEGNSVGKFGDGEGGIFLVIKYR